MKQENTDKLIKDFPLLFAHIGKERERSLTTIGRFGFECRDGWFDLIYELCTQVEEAIGKMPKEKQFEFRAFQVKEKFGGLRFYLVSNDEKLARVIARTEKKSRKTCETCGAAGVVRTGKWLRALCDEHAEGRAPQKV